MSLSIAPIGFNNTYTNKIQNKNNNRLQNFEALPIQVLKHPEDGKDVLKTFVKRDKVVDLFMCKVEEMAKKIGINTDAMKDEGYAMEFVPRFAFSSKMTAALKNKNQEVVQSINVRKGDEIEQAEKFVEKLKETKLG